MKKVLIGIKNATIGILTGLKSELSIRLHFLAAILVTVMGLYFQIDENQWLIIVITIAFVIASEMFNTAIEELCDLVQPNHDERIGRIKDIAAGATWLAAIASVVVGLIIFLPKIQAAFLSMFLSF